MTKEEKKNENDIIFKKIKKNMMNYLHCKGFTEMIIYKHIN